MKRCNLPNMQVQPNVAISHHAEVPARDLRQKVKFLRNQACFILSIGLKPHKTGTNQAIKYKLNIIKR